MKILKDRDIFKMVRVEPHGSRAQVMECKFCSSEIGFVNYMHFEEKHDLTMGYIENRDDESYFWKQKVRVLR